MAEVRVDLSAIERSLLRMSNAPITTASFLDHRAAPERMPEVWRGVEARVAAVLLANPWLAGRIDAKAKQLVYAPGPVARSRVDRIFRIEVMAKVGMQTPYRELGAKLRASGFLAGNAEPLWRVTLMPEAGTDGEQTRYVLIASMSHVVGDGHTYYRLLNMITGAAPVEALSPERSEAVLAAVNRKVGHALNSDPWFQLAGLWGILKGTLWNWRAALPADGGSLVASWLGWLRVDPAKASKVRMFYVDEEYVASEKAKAKEEGLVDYVSTNDVITSWFLKGMDIGGMAVNLRGRVEGCGEDLAGNYESGITFVGREDVEVPALVRKSLLNNRLRRVSDPEMPLAPHKPRKMPTRLAVFEKILGICTNWSSFFLPPQLGDSELLLHLPVYDLMRWPNLSLYHGMPVAIIFRATAERTGVAVFGFPDVVGPRLAMEGSLPGAPLLITTV